MKARVRGLDAMADWCGSHGREIPRQPETLAAGMVLTRSATHAGRFSQRRAGVMRKWESEASRLMDEKNPAIAGLWRLGKPWGSGRFAAQDMLLPQGESLVWWQLGQNDDGCFLPCAQRREVPGAVGDGGAQHRA